MVDKKINILAKFTSQGFGEMVKKASSIEKAITKIQAPKSISDAAGKTNFKNFNAEIASLGKISDKVRIPMQALTSQGWGLRKVMGMSLETMKQVNNQGLQKNFTMAGKTAFQFRRLTHGLRGFRMEMLGVMFFGMAMTRFFGGLLKPALDMVGIFNLLNITLGVVFLPMVLKLLDPLLDIMTWFMDLPEPVQTAMGVITLFGLALGTVVSVAGQLALGLGSLTLAMSGLAVTEAGDGIYKIGTAAKSSNGFVGGLTKSLTKLAGLGVLVWVGLRIFGREEAPTTAEFVTDLGLAALGGFMVGGPWGALAAFTLVMVTDLNKTAADQLERDLEERFGRWRGILGDPASHYFGPNKDQTYVPPAARPQPIIPFSDQYGLNNISSINVNVNAPPGYEAVVNWNGGE